MDDDGPAIVAALAIIAGVIGGLVSWIGALLNTAQLEDKTWFFMLLVLGLFSFGLVAMIAYVIAGPDGTRRTRPPRTAGFCLALGQFVPVDPPSFSREGGSFVCCSFHLRSCPAFGLSPRALWP